MFKGSMVATTEAHILELAKTIREDDKREIFALGYDDVLSALRVSASVSRDTRTGLTEDGRVIAIIGLSPIGGLSDAAVAWCITSDLVLQYRRAFVEQSAKVTQEWLGCYSRLFNFVDSRYTKAHRWLEAIGFKKEGEGTMGAGRMPFIRYEINR